MRAAALLSLGILVLAGLPSLDAEPAAGALTLGLECHLPPVRAMEWSYSDPTCWNHGGHHHFFLGADTSYLLRRVTGLAFSVEVEFGAPTEGAVPGVTPGPLNAGVYAPIVVETSLDGQAWQAAGAGTYDYVELNETQRCLQTRGLLDCALGAGLYRQDVLFDIVGQGQEFRFLRVRQPYSQATQGLSGFLDHTRLQLSVDPGPPVPPPALAPGARDLPCEAAMEAIGPDHPCWFGGLDRYDSPSYFHTWFLGEAVLSRVSFNATAMPWRSDDFLEPLPLSTRLPRFPAPLAAPLPWLAAMQADPVAGAGATADDARRFAGQAAGLGLSLDGLVARLHTNLTLQASMDGQVWSDVVRVYGPFGASLGAAVDLAGLEARFLRIVPEKHYQYDDFADEAPLHHPRGFVVAADLHVEGLLPP